MSSNIPKTYRSLLPLLGAPSPVRARTPLHSFVRATLSKLPSETPDSRLPPPSLAAAEFVTFLKAQKEYVTLVERYNPGLGAQMDEDERVRASAKRVGLDMPWEKKGKKE